MYGYKWEKAEKSPGSRQGETERGKKKIFWETANVYLLFGNMVSM